jgi:hypothetical protein
MFSYVRFYVGNGYFHFRPGNWFVVYGYQGVYKGHPEDFFAHRNPCSDFLADARQTEYLHATNRPNEAYLYRIVRYIFMNVSHAGCTGLGNVFYQTGFAQAVSVAKNILPAYPESGLHALRIESYQAIYQDKRGTLGQKFRHVDIGRVHLTSFCI